MSKSLLTLTLLVVLTGCASSDAPPADAPPEVSSGTPEERIVAYLEENVTPGKPVLVTELYNNVFTTPEDQAALKGLYDALFQIPGFAVKTQMESGKIPSLQEISTHFGFTVPGTTAVLLRVLESDPRVPRFFERDSTTGEITALDAEAVRNTERFADHLPSKD